MHQFSFILLRRLPRRRAVHMRTASLQCPRACCWCNPQYHGKRRRSGSLEKEIGINGGQSQLQMGGSAPNGLGLVNMPYTKPNPKPTLPLGAVPTYLRHKSLPLGGKCLPLGGLRAAAIYTCGEAVMAANKYQIIKSLFKTTKRRRQQNSRRWHSFNLYKDVYHGRSTLFVADSWTTSDV